MQEDQTTVQGELTVPEIAKRYFEGQRLTPEELAVIQSSRAATEEFITIVKRLIAQSCSQTV